MDEQEEILRDFLVECGEGLGRLDQEFVALEKDPTNASLLPSIFRTIHTIKGTCGFLGLPKLEGVAHRSEDILSKMRDRKMAVTPEGITLLLEAVDAIKEILAHIASTGKEPEKDYEPIRQKLTAFLSGVSVTPAAPPLQPFRKRLCLPRPFLPLQSLRPLPFLQPFKWPPLKSQPKELFLRWSLPL